MAQLPDGLIFEYELDHKGINLTCTQRELVKCRHCKHLGTVCTYIKNNDLQETYLTCDLLKCYVLPNHFCSEGERISESDKDKIRYEVAPLG